MADKVTAERIRSWIDDDLVTNVERVPDDAAEFNFAVELSNILVHVIRRESTGPLLIGQQIEYGEDILSRVRDLAPGEQDALVVRIREALTQVPIVYGFHDLQGNNVPFDEMDRIFVEFRIYPDGLSQHALMSGLIDVWKIMRYLDDMPSILDSVAD